MIRNKEVFQIIWGILLITAGIGLFFNIPQKMIAIAKTGCVSSGMFFIRFSFYLISILLIGGGSKKIYNYYCKLKASKPDDNHKTHENL